MLPTKLTSARGCSPLAPARGRPDPCTASLQAREDHENNVLSSGDSLLLSTSALKTSGNSERKAPNNGELLECASPRRLRCPPLCVDNAML